MGRMITTFILGILLLGGTVLLQVFLSKRESKIPGLILPIISFLFALLYPFSMIAPPEGVTAGFVFQVFWVWLLGNIPTIIFMAIYFGCRGKQRRNKQLDKMNIQDLD